MSLPMPVDVGPVTRDTHYPFPAVRWRVTLEA